MVWVTVAITPIFINDLTTSTPRIAIRLASSWTVIVSGIITSRITLCGSPDWVRRFCRSFSRARRTDARLRVRSSSSFKASAMVSLPDRRRRGSPRRPGAAGFLGSALVARLARSSASPSSASAFTLALTLGADSSATSGATGASTSATGSAAGFSAAGGAASSFGPSVSLRAASSASRAACSSASRLARSAASASSRACRSASSTARIFASSSALRASSRARARAAFSWSVRVWTLAAEETSSAVWSTISTSSTSGSCASAATFFMRPSAPCM